MFKNLRKQIEEDTTRSFAPLHHGILNQRSQTTITGDEEDPENFVSNLSLPPSATATSSNSPESAKVFHQKNTSSKDSSSSPKMKKEAVLAIDKNAFSNEMSLELELSELRSRHANLEKAYEGYRLKTGDSLLKKDCHIARLQERVENLEKKLDTLGRNEQLHSVIVERDLLKEKVEDLKRVLSEEGKTWQTKCKDMELEAEKKLAAFEEKLRLERTDWEAKCSTSQKKIASCEEKIRELTAGQREALERCAELDAELAALREEKPSDPEEKLRQMREQVNTAFAELEEVSSDRDKLRSRLKEILSEELKVMQKTEVETMQLREQLGQQQDYFESMDIQSENHITTLANQVEDLHGILSERHRDLNAMNCELGNKTKEVNSLRDRIVVLDSNAERQKDVIESLREELDVKRGEVREAENERDDLLLRNASLSHEVELVKRESGTQLDEIRAQLTSVSQELATCKAKLKQQEDMMDPEHVVHDLRKKVGEMEEAVKDRDTTIRLQQQRLTDMKKTLQKELKTSFGGESPMLGRSRSHVLVSSHLLLGSADDSNCLPHGVNFQYLKHVLLRFITSSDFEAAQLVKAVSTLLKLSQMEEQIIWDTLRWKQSWLPGVPKPRLPIQ